mgnify:CR=1 FL=1
MSYLLIILIAMLACFLLYKKGIFNSLTKNASVSQRYDSEVGNFVVLGKKNKFVITKDEYLSFLVEDGQIVACKDMRVGNEFKYYGGK